MFTLKHFSVFYLMPQTGIEPVREYKSRRILSPVRLPVPPLRHFRNAVAFQTTQKRLELSTSAVTGRRSNQLSHWAILKIYTFKTTYIKRNLPTAVQLSPLNFLSY